MHAARVKRASEVGKRLLWDSATSYFRDKFRVQIMKSLSGLPPVARADMHTAVGGKDANTTAARTMTKTSTIDDRGGSGKKTFA